MQSKPSNLSFIQHIFLTKKKHTTPIFVHQKWVPLNLKMAAMNTSTIILNSSISSSSPKRTHIVKASINIPRRVAHISVPGFGGVEEMEFQKFTNKQSQQTSTSNVLALPGTATLDESRNLCAFVCWGFSVQLHKKARKTLWILRLDKTQFATIVLG